MCDSNSDSDSFHSADEGDLWEGEKDHKEHIENKEDIRTASNPPSEDPLKYNEAQSEHSDDGAKSSRCVIESVEDTSKSTHTETENAIIECGDPLESESAEEMAPESGDTAFESFTTIQSEQLRTSEVEGNYTKVTEIPRSSTKESAESSEESIEEEHKQHDQSSKEGTGVRDESKEIIKSSSKSTSKSSKSDGWDEWEEEQTSSDHNIEEDTSGWEKWDADDLEQSKKPREEVTKSTGKRPPVKLDQTIENEKGKDEKAMIEPESSQSSLWSWTDITGAVAAVGENISSAVESSLGLPSPEDIVKLQVDRTHTATEETSHQTTVPTAGHGLFGGLITDLGSNLMTGSLDVLESLGKKTFERLTVQREGSKRRRFIFEQAEGGNLSDVLKELRDSQRIEQNTEQSQRETTFLDIFEQHGGLVHLEGLEMLSDNLVKRMSPDTKRSMQSVMKEALNEGLQDCHQDEHFANLPITDCIHFSSMQSVMKEALNEGLQDCHQDEHFASCLPKVLSAMGLPYNGSNLLASDKRCVERSQMPPMKPRDAFNQFLEVTADLTANSVEGMHKLGQLMLIAATRPSEKALCDLLSLIGRRISFFTNEYADHLNALSDGGDSVDELTTSVFLTAGDAFVYVQQSVRLLRPLLIADRDSRH